MALTNTAFRLNACNTTDSRFSIFTSTKDIKNSPKEEEIPVCDEE